MNKRTLKLVGWLAALVVALVLGVVAGGGAVYALTQNQQADTDVTVGTGDEPGILVASVVPESPAAEAGVKRGDIILKIGDTIVNHPGELINAMQDLGTDNLTEVTLMHGDEERILPVTLADRNGRTYLGVVPCGGTVAIRREFQPGATIVELVPGGPAEQAGLQRGDTITAINGQEIAPDTNLAEVIGSYAPGDTVTLTVERPGEEAREVTVTLGENPNEAGAAFLGVNFRTRPHIGFMRGRPFDRDHLPFDMPFDGDNFFMPGEGIENAIIVRNVAEDGPAAAAGLTRGSMITAINGEPVEGPDSLVAAVEAAKPGDTLTLTVKERGADGTQDITVTLGEDPDEPGSAYLGVMVGGFFSFHRNDDGVDITKEFFMIPGMEPDERSFDLMFKDFSMDDELENLPFFEKGLEFKWCDDAGGCLQFDGSI